MSRYSTADRVELIKLYYTLISLSKTVDYFKANHTNYDYYPNKGYVSTLVKKFESTGSVLDKKSPGRPLSATNENNSINVLAKFQATPVVSTYKVAAEVGLSQGSIMKILKRNRYFPFKPTFVQPLYDTDYERRMEFANWALERLEIEPEFYANIIWTDESKFFLNGNVNRQTTRWWSDKNPGFTMEGKPMNDPGLMAWGGLWGDEVIGPYFFDENVNGKTFGDMMGNEVIPLLETMPGFEDAIFQMDGAPAHFSLKVRAYFDKKFPKRWIGRGASTNDGMQEWCPRSPDLTPLDYFFWGYIKSECYKYAPRDLTELREAIELAFQKVTPQMLHNVQDEWEIRLRHTIAINGEQFEGLI